MSTHPLTHHEILGLVEPVTRRGRRVDLSASNRIERRLAFMPVEHPGETPALPALREILQLESHDGDSFRLTRHLTLPNGMQASLQADGPHPGELLACVESVEPQRQFRSGAGYVIALSHRVDAVAGPSSTRAAPPQLILVRAVAEVAGLTLRVKVSRVNGVPADIELAAADGCALDLPEDLLAVLGWDWGRIARVKAGWAGNVGLRGREPERSGDAESKLERTAQHLARTLAEAPGRFHERLVRARWVVVFRRAIPLLGVIAMFAAAIGVSYVELAENSIFRMMIFHAPPLLLAFFFLRREMPRIEFPPLPRASTASSWRRADSGGERSSTTR